MLTFEQKRAIINSFDLKEKEISNQRYVYEYHASKQRGKVVAWESYMQRQETAMF